MIVPHYFKKLIAAFALIAINGSGAFAIDARFELDPKLLDRKVVEPSREKPVKEKPVQEKPAKEAPHQASAEAGTVTRVVKPGDHVFKILMRDFNLTNDEAEKLIPEVKRLNKLDDIRNLRIGSTIVLPLPAKAKGKSVSTSVARQTKKHARTISRPRREGGSKEASPPAEPAVHQMTMMKLSPPPANLDAVDVVRQVWDKLMPGAGGTVTNVDVQDINFSVTLDPDKFPVVPAADGGKIIIDSQGALPPLVKSLLMEKDPGLRVVSENPANRRRFFGSLIAAANFYSVEEDFAVDFGSDPKITVRADYKIERSADSLMKHDVVLMNVTDNRRSIPDRLVEFLRSEGFKVVEATPGNQNIPTPKNTFYSIRGNSPQEVADGLLKALSLKYDSEKNIELTGWEGRGIRMFVKVDRYFEEKGERYAVTLFDGNPVNYTLTRLLETVGFKVIVLDPKDDFRRVTEKVAGRLKLPGRYGVHSLWTAPDIPYTVQMSGMMLKNTTAKGGGTFITDIPTSPVIEDLLTFNGYTLLE